MSHATAMRGAACLAVLIAPALAVAGATTRPAKAATQPDPAAVASAKAVKAYRLGVQMIERDKPIEARGQLSSAVLSRRLPPGEDAKARAAAIRLARRSLLGPEFLEGDPYCLPYTIRSGDLLARIVRTRKLRVPYQALMRINRISDARKIRVGRRIKLLRGPVHAVISKKAYRMDLYVRRNGQLPALLTTVRVGMGKDDATPTGAWRVRRGGKLTRADWYPPASSGKTRVIRFGEPGYPLGTKGYWIALEGLDKNTRGRSGFGIHGTDKPASIGKSMSLGCIRLADADIEWVYALLEAGHSMIRVIP